MCAHIAVGTFQLECCFQHSGHITAFIAGAAQVVAFLECFLEGYTRAVRHERCKQVDLFQRKVINATDILDGRLGSHGAKSPDLGNASLAIALADICNDLVTAVLAKIDIDIRRLSPIRIKKSFKKKIVFQRAHMAQFQGIAYQRSAG